MYFKKTKDKFNMFKNTNAFIEPVRNSSKLSQSDVHQEEVIKHGGGGKKTKQTFS